MKKKNVFSNNSKKGLEDHILHKVKNVGRTHAVYAGNRRVSVDREIRR